MQSIKALADASASTAGTFAKNLAKDAHIPAIKAGAIAVAQKATNFTSTHPVACGAVIVGTGIIAAPGFFALPALGAAGFTTNGIAAGTTAAATHSYIGNVVGGGVFATLQSAGMGGYGVAVVNGATQAVGAAMVSAGGAIMAKFKL